MAGFQRCKCGSTRRTRQGYYEPVGAVYRKYKCSECSRIIIGKKPLTSEEVVDLKRTRAKRRRR